MIIFDIETKPRVDLVRRFIKSPGPFDPGAVKYGNTKDPVKRAELLTLKENDYATEVQAFWKQAEERASLNPLTAEILCIGLLVEDNPVILSGPESEVLADFWTAFSDHRNISESFVFWSGNGKPEENFDVDMIVRRSWALGVKVPATLFNGRYYTSRVVDAAARYLLGKREAYCGLSDAADQLGLFEDYHRGHPSTIFPKTDADPVKGVNFFQWWDGAVTDCPLTPSEQRAKATQYLRNDLLILDAIAERIL